MRRHVVRPFVGVDVVGGVFGNHHVEMTLKVAAHRRVGVFVDGQGGGTVLDEDVGQADGVLGEFGYGRFYLMGNQMEAAGYGRECYGFLCPGRHVPIITVFIPNTDQLYQQISMLHHL